MGSFRSFCPGLFSLSLALWLTATPVTGSAQTLDPVELEARTLQTEWTGVFYGAPDNHRAEKYKVLLERARNLKARQPDRAEPLIVEAIILCTYSSSALGLDTLDMLEQARTLLLKAIDIAPPALDGAAYVTLGNLYRRLPGWPILYGDKQQARRYFEAGVRLYPDGIDTNYFFGDFLQDEGDTRGALHYLERASKAPIRPNLKTSDSRLKQETDEALAALRSGKSSRSDFFSLFTPSFDSH